MTSVDNITDDPGDGGFHAEEPPEEEVKEKEKTKTKDYEAGLEFIRNQVFNMPLLPQGPAVEMFHALDRSLQRSIEALLTRTNFVEAYLSSVVAEVAASVTHGRTIYGRIGNRKTRAEEDVFDEDETDSSGVFKRASDVRFLEQSINIMRVLAHVQNVDLHDAEAQKDVVRRLVKDIKFVRLVYEEVIQSFRYNTKGYLALADRCVEVHSLMQTAKTKSLFAQYVDEYANLHDRMLEVEHNVCADRSYLWHLCRFIDGNYEKQLRFRDYIHQPYLRIVYKEAKKHATNEQQILDNFQNGSTGLLRAISCYNLDQNVSFSSYAHWWIRQSILFHIKDSSNFMKLPVTTWQTFTSIEKQRAKIVSREGNDSVEALATETGHSVAKIKEVYDSIRTSHVHSLDYEVDESGKMMLIDVIPDQSIEDNEQQSDIQQDVASRLDVLDAEQRWYVLLHYGMFHLLPHREEINRADVMQEKIRQRLAAVGR